jgi:putative tryptophan/tyrosine transport system substrate-binding protein
VQAQHPIVPIVGYLGFGSPEMYEQRLAGFREGLREAGFEEGRNCQIEYRWALNQQERLPALASELVQRRPAVLAAMLSTSVALALKAATSTIPIVFSVASDPVQIGLVSSMSRPGGNATGIYYISLALGEKRLGLLHELIPGLDRVAALINPNSPLADAAIKDLQVAASAIGMRIDVLHARNKSEIDVALESLVQTPLRAFIVSTDPVFTNRRVQLVLLAARYSIPAIYTSREFVEAGGLMSYGTSLPDVMRTAGAYVGHILNGAKPADLPVMEPTKFELLINLQTAKLLRIEVPTTLLARADEVIE